MLPVALSVCGSPAERKSLGTEVRIDLPTESHTGIPKQHLEKKLRLYGWTAVVRAVQVFAQVVDETEIHRLRRSSAADDPAAPVLPAERSRIRFVGSRSISLTLRPFAFFFRLLLPSFLYDKTSNLGRLEVC